MGKSIHLGSIQGSLGPCSLFLLRRARCSGQPPGILCFPRHCPYYYSTYSTKSCPSLFLPACVCRMCVCLTAEAYVLAWMFPSEDASLVRQQSPRETWVKVGFKCWCCHLIRCVLWGTILKQPLFLNQPKKKKRDNHFHLPRINKITTALGHCWEPRRYLTNITSASVLTNLLQPETLQLRRYSPICLKTKAKVPIMKNTPFAEVKHTSPEWKSASWTLWRQRSQIPQRTPGCGLS